MTRTIQILPDELASQIAAGEVVERPASVVKELVENALDAGARRIDVSITGGGIALIEIRDDGRGMSPEDASVCIERHATSKLRAFGDLDRLASYGFRGEALPSIAAVSRLSLTTRSHGFESGSVLSLTNGTPSLSPIGAPIGTTISVAELFYNVPARRKFLRSTGTESSHVGDVIEGAALSRHEVAFSLERDGRVARSYPRANDRAERVAQILKGEALVQVRGERGPLGVEAYLSAAERARQGAGGLLLVLNGRPIKDRALCATIAHAYGSALERGRYPRGVVYLELEPGLVDVNVHPQKTEVRFADPRAVAEALYGIVAHGLGTKAPSPAAPASRDAAQSEPPRVSAPATRRSSNWTHTKPVPAYAVREPGQREPQAGEPPRERGPSEPPREEELETAESGWKRLRYVARLKSRFLACEGDDGLYLLDARATRQAVLTAELGRDYQGPGLRSQSLLFPITVPLGAGEAERVENASSVCTRLGLDLRVRGDVALSIHALPSKLERIGPEAVVRLLLDELATTSGRVELGVRVLARWVELLTAARDGATDAESRMLIGAFAKLDLTEAERSQLVLSFTSFSLLARKLDEP